MAKLKKDGTVSRQGEGSSGRKPLKWNNPQELEQHIQEYYTWAEENKKHVTVTGLAWWLDTDRISLLRYENNEEWNWLKSCSDEDRKSYSNTIKRAKRYIEMNYENSLFDKNGSKGAMFTLKNNYDWKDKQEIVTTNKDEIQVDIIED